MAILMKEKIFNVIRMNNGLGHSNLFVIVEEAIPDIFIGTALMIPYVNGLKDPKEVKLLVDEKEQPIATKIRTCIVTEYIY